MTLLKIKPPRKPTIRLRRENLESALDMAANNENKKPGNSLPKIARQKSERASSSVPKSVTVAPEPTPVTPPRQLRAPAKQSPSASPVVEFDKADPKWYLETDWTKRERPKFRHPSLMSFMIAVENGNREVVREYLAKGMDPNKLVRYRLLNTIIRMASVHCAAYAGQFEIFCDLVEAGGDPELRDDWYGGTPLHWAAYAEDYDMTKAMLQKFKCDRTARNTEDQLAFDLLSEETPEWRALLLDGEVDSESEHSEPASPETSVETAEEPVIQEHKNKRVKLDSPSAEIAPPVEIVKEPQPEPIEPAVSSGTKPSVVTTANQPASKLSTPSNFQFSMAPFSLPFPYYGPNSTSASSKGVNSHHGSLNDPLAVFAGPPVRRESSSAITPIVSKVYVQSCDEDVEMPRRVPVAVSSSTGAVLHWNASVSGANVILDLAMTQHMRSILNEANSKSSYYIEMKRNGKLELSTGEKFIAKQWERTVSPTAAVAAYAVGQTSGRKGSRDLPTVSNLVSIIDSPINSLQSPIDFEPQAPWMSLDSKKIKVSLVHGYNLLEFLVLVRLSDSERFYLDRISSLIYNC